MRPRGEAFKTKLKATRVLRTRAWSAAGADHPARLSLCTAQNKPSPTRADEDRFKSTRSDQIIGTWGKPYSAMDWQESRHTGPGRGLLGRAEAYAASGKHASFSLSAVAERQTRLCS
jgi:hypothetical protein